MVSTLKVKANQLIWKTISCPRSELSLAFTLEGGQSFRWEKLQQSGMWRGVFANKVWTLWQDDEQLHYTAFPSEDETEDENLLNDYFQLKINMGDLYEEWSKKDTHFASIAPRYQGVRVLRQDPVENLFSFLCSSNNRISRITSMISKMCLLYGDILGEIDGCIYRGFPSVEQLATETTERQLKIHKFGYHAPCIAKTAFLVKDKGGTDWLGNLRNVSYEEARIALLQLPGVGRKVADCVCLMSLDKTQSVPIDTHIFQMASKAYLMNLTQKKHMTDRIYQQIGDHFRTTFGTHAGWAQSVLFTSDLDKFKDKNPAKKIYSSKPKSEKILESQEHKSKKLKQS